MVKREHNKTKKLKKMSTHINTSQNAIQHNNPNVNDHYNYTNTFIRKNNTTVGIPLLKTCNILLNSQTITGDNNFEFYNILQPFLKFPKAYYPFGFGIYSYSLYPINSQQSGTINMSTFSNISMLYKYNITDVFNSGGLSNCTCLCGNVSLKSFLSATSFRL